MGATQLLARHVMEHMAYDLLPAEVVATAKEMMLNAAAVALAAADPRRAATRVRGATT